MKIDNIVSIYKIDLGKATTAQVLEMVPNVENLPVNEALPVVKDAVVRANTALMDDERCEAELAKISKCGICGQPGKLVTLMRNRPAYFCQAHNIVNPVPIELIKKYDFDYEPTR